MVTLSRMNYKLQGFRYREGQQKEERDDKMLRTSVFIG